MPHINHTSSLMVLIPRVQTDLCEIKDVDTIRLPRYNVQNQNETEKCTHPRNDWRKWDYHMRGTHNTENTRRSSKKSSTALLEVIYDITRL